MLGRRTTAFGFRDAQQRARVCRELLRSVGLEKTWELAGPTPSAQASPPSASEGDAVRLLSVCWTIWVGSSSVSLSEVLALRPDRLRLVASLLDACAGGPGSVDDWLEEHRDLDA